MYSHTWQIHAPRWPALLYSRWVRLITPIITSSLSVLAGRTARPTPWVSKWLTPWRDCIACLSLEARFSTVIGVSQPLHIPSKIDRSGKNLKAYCVSWKRRRESRPQGKRLRLSKVNCITASIGWKTVREDASCRNLVKVRFLHLRNWARSENCVKLDLPLSARKLQQRSSYRRKCVRGSRHGACVLCSSWTKRGEWIVRKITETKATTPWMCLGLESRRKCFATRKQVTIDG